jgi:Uma2 family endonuclease
MVLETAFRSEERFTQAEFRRWLEERPANDTHHYELIRGQIVMSPPAGWRHASVGSALNLLAGSHVREQRLGRLFDSSAGYELPSGDTLEPDFSFVSNARWQALPKPLPEGFLPIDPDLVVETLSKSTAKRDRAEKWEIYAENGVDEYWIVDQDRREVTVFRREGGRFDGGRVVRTGRLSSRVLPELELTAEQLFEDLE